MNSARESTATPSSHDSVVPDVQSSSSSTLLSFLGLYVLYQLSAYYGISVNQLLYLPFRVLYNPLIAARTSAEKTDGVDPATPSNGGMTPSSALKVQKWSSGLVGKLLGLPRDALLNSTVMGQSLRRISEAADETNVKPPLGLGNWDNSCYQNSVIQGLASLPSLRHYLSTNLSPQELNDEDSTMTSLLDTITKLNQAGASSSYMWTPRKLKSMSSFQQQDAQEYYSKVLDEIDKESRKSARDTSNSTGLRMLKEEGSESPDLVEETSTRNAPLPNPLDGLLAQRVACTHCGYTEGLSLIPFNCLTVPVGNKAEHHILDCLDEYTSLETIDGVHCAKCTLLKSKESLEQLLARATTTGKALPENLKESVSQRLKRITDALNAEDFEDATLIKDCQIPKKNWVSSNKTRQAIIARAPESLVIHVNRSVFDELTGILRKNYTNIKFDNEIDLLPWCLGSRQNSDGQSTTEEWTLNPKESMVTKLSSPGHQELTYRLRAVITHYGRHENGHYICFRKHGPTSTDDERADERETAKEQGERWWQLSDHQVYEVTDQDVLDQGGVFMLFLERVRSSAAEKTLYPGDVVEDCKTSATNIPNAEDLVSPSVVSPPSCPDSEDLVTEDQLMKVKTPEPPLDSTMTESSPVQSGPGSPSLRSQEDILPVLENSEVQIPRDSIYISPGRTASPNVSTALSENETVENQQPGSSMIPTERIEGLSQSQVLHQPDKNLSTQSSLEALESPAETTVSTNKISGLGASPFYMRTAASAGDRRRDGSHSSLPMVAAT